MFVNYQIKYQGTSEMDSQPGVCRWVLLIFKCMCWHVVRKTTHIITLERYNEIERVYYARYSQCLFAPLETNIGHICHY